MSFCVRSIRIFSKFSSDPYYEPLSWFMICVYVTGFAKIVPIGTTIEIQFMALY